jgi:hypothetical protein
MRRSQISTQRKAHHKQIQGGEICALDLCQLNLCLINVLQLKISFPLIQKTMKNIAIAIATFITSTMLIGSAMASSEKSPCKNSGEVYVTGYVRKSGVRVKPSCRTTRNTTTKDNWSTIGNVNPYTGKKGTKRP